MSFVVIQHAIQAWGHHLLYERALWRTILQEYASGLL